MYSSEGRRGARSGRGACSDRHGMAFRGMDPKRWWPRIIRPRPPSTSASITFQLHGQTWVAAPVIKHDPRSPPETWAPTRASQALLKHILSTGGAQLLTEEATDRRASLQEVGHLQPDTSSPGSPRGSSLAAASSTPEFLAESRTCRCKEGSSPATISSTLPAESNYSPADDGAAASPADCTFGGEWTFAFEDGFVPDWGGSESDADNSTSASE